MVNCCKRCRTLIVINNLCVGRCTTGWQNRAWRKTRKKPACPESRVNLLGGRDVLILEGMDSHTNVHRARWVGGLCSKKTTWSFGPFQPSSRLASVIELIAVASRSETLERALKVTQGYQWHGSVYDFHLVVRSNCVHDLQRFRDIAVSMGRCHRSKLKSREFSPRL